MELTFLIAAHVELCFAYVARVVLITNQSFGYCWAVLAEHQGCLSNLSHQRPVGSGWTNGWEGTQLGQLTPTDQRDILYHMTPCWAIGGEWGGGKRGSKTAWLTHWSSKAPTMLTEVLLPSKWLDISYWWEAENTSPLFILIPCVAFAFLIKLPLSTHELVCYIFSHSPVEEGTRLTGGQCVCLASSQDQPTTIIFTDF